MGGSVVFLHGLGETPAVWNPVIEHLPCGYNLRAVRVFARPDFDGGWSLQKVTDRIATELTGRSHVVGLSLGAVIGLDLAIRYPHLAESLFLSAPQAKPPQTLMRVQSVFMRLLPAKLVCPPGVTKPELLEVLTAVSRLNLEPVLPSIGVPTTVVCGAKDKANQPAAATIAQRIPGASLEIITDAKHQWHTAMPAEFAKTLITHLANT